MCEESLETLFSLHSVTGKSRFALIMCNFVSECRQNVTDVVSLFSCKLSNVGELCVSFREAVGEL
jgi:hypothetical protein